jgi:hypothetical protein
MSKHKRRGEILDDHAGKPSNRFHRWFLLLTSKGVPLFLASEQESPKSQAHLFPPEQLLFIKSFIFTLY